MVGWQYIEVAGQLSPSPVHFVGVGAHCKSGKLRGLEENARDGIILSSGSPPGWEHNTTSSMGTTASLFSDHIALWTLCQSVANMVNQIEPDQFVASVIFLSSKDKRLN